MDFGSVVLEHRPVVICQCKWDLCLKCNTPINEHKPYISECYSRWEEKIDCEDCADHSFYQRSKTFGPRVVIDQTTHIGKCHDCGKSYTVNITEHMTAQEYADHVGVH